MELGLRKYFQVNQHHFQSLLLCVYSIRNCDEYRGNEKNFYFLCIHHRNIRDIFVSSKPLQHPDTPQSIYILDQYQIRNRSKQIHLCKFVWLWPFQVFARELIIRMAQMGHKPRLPYKIYGEILCFQKNGKGFFAYYL